MHSLYRLKWYSFIRWQFFFFILQLFTSQVFSQTPFLRKYTVDDGLPSSHVYRVFQDSEGFMWVCTDRGLSRFDGYKFENFSGNNQLPYNDIWDIAEDKFKRLWIASFSYSVTYYDMKKRKFVIVSTENVPQFSKGKITRIRAYKDEAYLENVHDIKNPCKIDISTNKIYQTQFSKKFLENIGVGKPVGNDFYPQTLAVNFGFFLNEDNFLPISKCKIGTNYFIPITSKDVFYSTKTELHYLTEKYDHYKTLKELSANPNNEIIRIDKISNTGLLLVFTKSEKFIVDKNLHRLKRFDFVNDYSVNSIYIDNEENFWIATENEGLLLVSKETQNSSMYSKLNGRAIKAIFSPQNNDIWLGADNGNLYHIKNGISRELTVIKDLLSPVRKLLIVNDYLIAIWHFGDLGIFPLKYLDKHSAIKPQKEIYTDGKQGFTIPINNGLIIKNMTGKNLSLGSDSTILVGCANEIRTLKIYERSVTYRRLATAVRCYSIVENVKDSTFYVGSSNGLYTIKSKDFSINEHYAKQYKNLDKTINDLVFDEHENLWVSPDIGKLIRVKNANIEEINDFKNIVVKRFFYEKNKGRIWAATNQGVFILSNLGNKEVSIRRISLIHGLPTLEVHDVNIVGSKLYAGTNNGLVEININFLSEKRQAPKSVPLIIKQLQINGSDTTVCNNYELKYTQNSINIDFVALSYKSDKNIKYQYKLVSDESNISWKEIQDTKLAFSYLSPGIYKFYLRAFDIEGNEAKLYQPIVFQINPPYWQTWWFRLFMGFIIVGIVGATIFGYKKNTEKNLRVSKKLAELELHALQSQMNPHFVFNALSSVQSFILNKDTNAANEFLANFSRLIRLFLESSRNRYISIADEKDLLEKYIELEQARFRNKFTYEITDINLVESSQEIPSMLLQPFVENAINHGLVYKEGAGHLSITFKNENQYLYCTIEDDGVGRKKAKELRTRAIKAYKSRATEIIDERLRTLKMVDGTDVSVNIIDKVDENNISTGTKVEIKILMS